MTAVPHHPLFAEPMSTEEPRNFHVPCPISAHLATDQRTWDRHLGAVAGRVGLAATPPPHFPGQSVTGRPCCPARLATAGPTGSVLATLTLQTRGTGTAPPPAALRAEEIIRQATPPSAVLLPAYAYTTRGGWSTWPRRSLCGCRSRQVH